MNSQNLKRSLAFAAAMGLTLLAGLGRHHHAGAWQAAASLLLAAVFPLVSAETGTSESLHTAHGSHFMGDGVLWEADPYNFRLTAVAGDLQGTLGYTAEQWLTEPDFWIEHIAAADRERVLKACLSAIEGGNESFRLEYEAADVRGERAWVENFLQVLRDSTGRPRKLMGRMVNRTEQKRATEAHRQSQKMEEVGLLAGGVAHDFSNLLTVIGGHADLLLSSLDVQDPRRASVEEIKKAGDRAASLIRQLLGFSRRRSSAREPLDLSLVVGNLSRMLRRLIGEHIELVTLPSPRLAPVLADTGQIEQVILNLVVNARDAMAGGGRLVIETAEFEVQELKPKASVPPGRYVILSVTDAGCGIDTATLGRIYEPFFTTKEPGKGTGLGLATVKEIVRDSGGYIEVESTVGEGTTFRIYFPRMEPGSVTAAAHLVTVNPRRGCETILVAEDEKNVLAMSRQLLSAYGYRVLEAASGEEALRVAERYPGAIDLLLADVVMPGMNGRELADILKGRRPETKVLYMSGYTRDEVLCHAFPRAEVPYLQKPFTPQTLATVVRRVLDRHSEPARDRPESKPRLV